MLAACHTGGRRRDGNRCRVVLGEREIPITADCGGPGRTRRSGRGRAVGRCRLGGRRHATAAERIRFRDGRVGLGHAARDSALAVRSAWVAVSPPAADSLILVFLAEARTYLPGLIAEATASSGHRGLADIVSKVLMISSITDTGVMVGVPRQAARPPGPRRSVPALRPGRPGAGSS